MKSIVICAEGGETVDQQARLRGGLNALLKEPLRAARDKRLKWNVVFCGSRKPTLDRFLHSLKSASSETLSILLVDSEGPVESELPVPPNETQEEKLRRLHLDAEVRKRHLMERPQDRWTDLADVEPELIHLMIQCMEAWIVADTDALAKFYGHGFAAARLPARQCMEDVPKVELFDRLKRSTQDSKKGKYAKIDHGCPLLERIDSAKVAVRCPRFRALTVWLNARIAAA